MSIVILLLCNDKTLIVSRKRILTPVPTSINRAYVLMHPVVGLLIGFYEMGSGKPKFGTKKKKKKVECLSF